MKKLYSKPLIEIESYALSASIAASCGNVINVGPGIPGADPEGEYRQCSDFGDSGFIYSIKPQIGLNSTGNKPFYNDGSNNCDCYYTSGGMGYFTS